MRILAVVMALAVLATGCGAAALPTDPNWHPSGGDICLLGGLDGVLRGSTADPRVAWMEDRVTGARRELVWPAGYDARFTPALEVLDDHDQTVGRAGDRVIGTCSSADPGTPIRVSGDDLRPPDWQPGDG